MSEKLSLSVPQDLAVGRMAVLVPSITPVEEWVYGTSARESWDIREFPDQLIITPKRPGSVEIGVRAGGSKTTTWTEIVVPGDEPKPTPAPTPWKWPSFGWLAKLVPSGERIKAAGKLAGVASLGALAVVLWFYFQSPRPVPPGPKPEPQPTPIVESPLWIVVVEESADRTPEHAKLLKSKAIADRVKAKGHQFRVIDKDSKDSSDGTADFGPYIERSKGKQGPQLFLVTPAGDVRFEGPCPTPEAAFLDTLGKAGG